MAGDSESKATYSFEKNTREEEQTLKARKIRSADILEHLKSLEDKLSILEQASQKKKKEVQDSLF